MVSSNSVFRLARGAVHRWFREFGRIRLCTGISSLPGTVGDAYGVASGQSGPFMEMEGLSSTSKSAATSSSVRGKDWGSRPVATRSNVEPQSQGIDRVLSSIRRSVGIVACFTRHHHVHFSASQCPKAGNCPETHSSSLDSSNTDGQARSATTLGVRDADASVRPSYCMSAFKYR